MTRMSRLLIATAISAGTICCVTPTQGQDVFASVPHSTFAIPRESSDPPAAASSDENVSMSYSPDVSFLIDTAMANSPAIQQALADVQKARGLRFQSTRSPNPVAGYLASEVGNDGRAGQQGVFWSQTIRRAEKLDLNDRIGSWEVTAATYGWQIEQKRVAGTVQMHWYAAAAAYQQVRVLNRLDAVLGKAVETTKSLMDAGESSRTPHLQAQLERRENSLQIRNAESAFEAVRRQLATVVATPVQQIPNEFQGLEQALGIVDEESFIADLLANSPELHLARARVSQNQSNVCRQEVEPKTDLQAQFAVQYDDSTKDTVSGIQLGFTLPLFDRNKGNVTAASAEYLRACQEVRRKELELTRMAAATYRDYTVANRDVQTIDSVLLPLAQENLTATSEGFKLGEAEYQSLLTAQRSYVQLIVSRIDALRRVRQSEARLNSYLLANNLTE